MITLNSRARFIVVVFPEEDYFDEELYPPRATWVDAFKDFVDQMRGYLTQHSLTELDENCHIDLLIDQVVVPLHFSGVIDLAYKVGLLVDGIVQYNTLEIDEKLIVQAYEERLEVYKKTVARYTQKQTKPRNILH